MMMRLLIVEEVKIEHVDIRKYGAGERGGNDGSCPEPPVTRGEMGNDIAGGEVSNQHGPSIEYRNGRKRAGQWFFWGVKIIFDKRTKQEHYPFKQGKEQVMGFFKIAKSSFECAAFMGALGTMVFWAEIVTSFTG